MEHKSVLTGFAIVVLDRGFVYVGKTEVDDSWCVITEARNIRQWGTTQGLGELALNGPQPKTVLDAVGTVRAPLRAVTRNSPARGSVAGCGGGPKEARLWSGPSETTGYPAKPGGRRS